MKNILDHIAIAVTDFDKAKTSYEALGVKFSDETEIVESEKVEVLFGALSDGSNIELLRPLNNEGPIQKYLDKKGPGIHHICLKCDDILETMASLTKKGLKFIYDEPRKGAGGHLVNFVHPKSNEGVLLEIVQK